MWLMTEHVWPLRLNVKCGVQTQTCPYSYSMDFNYLTSVADFILFQRFHNCLERLLKCDVW